MKLSSQHLRVRAKGPLHSLECIDLSRLELGSYDKLSICPKLHAVNLSRNDIDYVSSFEGCPHLWKIDLSNNEICNLEGVSRFVALGSLLLCNNDLTWSELSKLRHMHILNLSLHGNPQLEKDPYYRIHVIDSLPNVWMLDGRIITSAERLQVQNFFEESALTERPVRHKLSKEQFIPTSRKKIAVTGLFGHRTDHLMRRFPTNGSLNMETDQRRIIYLAHNLQEDLIIESKYSNRNWGSVSHNNSCIEDLLRIREQDRVRCNMMLLLLVASLEFAVPSHLMQEALKCAKLGVIGNVDTMELFLLPKEVRCHIVSLLLSAVKVDKDSGEEGGLYDKLYLCLYNSVSELTRLAQGGTRTNNSKQSLASEKMSKCLIASEVVQLLCIVPAFFSYVTKDSGVMNLVTMATSDLHFVDRVQKLIQKMEQNKWEIKKIYENIAELILRTIQDNTASLVNRRQKQASKDNYVLGTSKAALKRPQSSPIFASQYHMKGRPSPDNKPVRIKSGKPYRGSYIPQAKLGDKVLLGPQNIARVISIPEPEMVLVQMDIVPDETGAMISNRKVPEEHYKYIDINHLYWDHMASYWRPIGTTGDRITMKTEAELEADLVSQAQRLATKDAPLTEIYPPTPRLVTPLKLPTQIKVEDTRAVSARYKESLQLTLELGELCDSSDKSKDDTEPISYGPPPSRAKSAVSRTQSQEDTRAVSACYKESLQLTLELGELCDSSDKSEDDTEPISYGPPPSRAKSAVSRTQSQTKESKASTRAVLSDPEDGEEDEVLYSQSRVSHDSSLASDDEPELKEIVESRPSTRPGTAAKSAAARKQSEDSGAAGPTVTTGTGTPECPIEIPQVDAESQDTTTRTLLSDASASPKKSKQDGAEEALESIEPNEGKQESSMEEGGYGLEGTFSKGSVDLGTTGLVSSTERQLMAEVVRTEIDIPLESARNQARSSPLTTPHNTITLDVKDSLKTRGSILMTPRPASGYDQYSRRRTFSPVTTKKPDSRAESPPPQRPPSPLLNGRGHKKSHNTVQLGSTWLGGGRDLHWENRPMRPKSGHVPGWKDGLTSRPKSAAAARALKRSKTPHIVTPSSIAFDESYGRHRYPSTADLDQDYITMEYSAYNPGSQAQQQQQQQSYHQSIRRNKMYSRAMHGSSSSPLDLGAEIHHKPATSSMLSSYVHRSPVFEYLHGSLSEVHITGQAL